MKPSNFILNSDYLSIAQTSKNTYSLTVNSTSIAGQGGYIERNYDFTATSVAGAVDRIFISKDGGRYYIGSYRSINPSGDIYGFISVYRTSSTNIRAQVVLENYSYSAATFPAMTFSIKVVTFQPPNVL